VYFREFVDEFLSTATQNATLNGYNNKRHLINSRFGAMPKGQTDGQTETTDRQNLRYTQHRAVKTDEEEVRFRSFFAKAILRETAVFLWICMQ